MPIALKTAGAAIIELLASENRRVLSDWRALLLLRRASKLIPKAERRWKRIPRDIHDMYPILRQMNRRGQIQPLASLSNIYEITVPYVSTSQIEEDEVLMEIHPYASICNLSALVFHGLTQELPKEIFALISTGGINNLLPPGTTTEDWKELALVPGRMPKTIMESRVRWVRTKPEWYFGTEQYMPRGFPIRVTTPERTLLDGLKQPELCGGLENVLQAWAQAQDILDMTRLINYVNQFNIHVLRQRVGFILDELHLSHPILEEWRLQSQRGGSSKLLGSAPYSPNYNKSWNLSINASITSLYEGGV